MRPASWQSLVVEVARYLKIGFTSSCPIGGDLLLRKVNEIAFANRELSRRETKSIFREETDRRCSCWNSVMAVGLIPFLLEKNYLSMLSPDHYYACVTRVLRRWCINSQQFQTLLQAIVSLHRLSPTHYKTPCFVTPLLSCFEAYMYA